MHARLTTVQSTPEQLPELMQQIEKQALPALRLQPGFKHLVVLKDSESKLVSLTLWETEADEQATFGREYLNSMLSESTLLLLTASRSESYEVLLASEKP